jgi:rfaE bifunctional protein nucleotidyltransferase chain/domain
MKSGSDPRDKVVDLPTLLERLEARRALGESVVLTNGCFELLHRGHVRYLAAAARLGDVLVVGVNGDRSVRLLKGNSRALVPAVERAEVVAALGSVDYVTIFEEPTAERLVRAIQPRTYVKGGDYAGAPPVEAQVVESLGGTFQALELVPDTSTTSLLQRIRASE